MIKTINTLLVTTAICGLLAASPAGAASGDDRTAGAMPTVTIRDAGVTAKVSANTDAAEASARVSATTTVTHTRLTIRDVTAIQKLLAEKGFYKTKVDGQFGPGTQDAMREYQASEGLEANGYPTVATLEKLGVTPENAPVTGDAEPSGKGGVIYTETVERKDVTEKLKGSGFANVDTNSQNGGNCLHCTNGPIGNGGTKSMNSNAF
jgi:peptidoglycan hydrolase-like protein with peptidoglycan-binding domain